MSIWVRALLFAFVGAFMALAAYSLANGDSKAAWGAFLIAALACPLLIEACWPSKYALRKPSDGTPDTLSNRLRQFRSEHPGMDGTLLLGTFVAISLATVAGGAIGLLASFNFF
ncbi:hypothetical protein [uncultured Pseudomonas sp.]|uniref:hypothetical protein n=1 Tax=uncultured Pseudomonas sp. TaxID=114707 RepID=UPI002590B742|nr:hypothetical protein [uncultured Pseudomonas sp.]